MILENMIRKEVKEMPPSGIRKYFDRNKYFEKISGYYIKSNCI